MRPYGGQLGGHSCASQELQGDGCRLIAARGRQGPAEGTPTVQVLCYARIKLQPSWVLGRKASTDASTAQQPVPWSQVNVVEEARGRASPEKLGWNDITHCHNNI